MKSYSVIVVVAILFLIIACGKERTCTCITTNSGVKTVRTQNAPNVINLPPLPTVTISPATDQTTSNPYNIETTNVVTYDRIKYKVALQVCTTTSEEKVNTTQTNVTGTSTITTTDVGTSRSVCTLD